MDGLSGIHHRRLPTRRELYYGGKWHAAGASTEITCPATGESLGRAGVASAAEVDAAVSSARAAFTSWRSAAPLDRADRLKALASVLRRHADELASIDALDCGSPISEMLRDVEMSARGLEYFAGLVTETKGETIPVGAGFLNFTVREPLGVVARIVAYNHPLMFATMRSAAALAAGNTLIVKPAEQTPLSCLRVAEIIHDEQIFPDGVFNVVTGGGECGAALAGHPGVARVAMIGSVPTGKAILRAAAEHVKSVGLEMGGKNALLAFPDAEPADIAAGAIAGMNLTWAGQSCGSTSRIFLHESHHDEVLDLMVEQCGKYKPGHPLDASTTMGSLIDAKQLAKVEQYVAWGIEDGAQLTTGGDRLSPPDLREGNFFAPTIFRNVSSSMRIAQDEIFGPVISVFRWSNEDDLFAAVNSVSYGLTAAIFTKDLACAHRAASRVEAGYVWVNHAGPHFIGAPFGGYKESGVGREESLDELLACTQLKNVNIKLGT